MIIDDSIKQLGRSLAAATRDLKRFKEDQPALARRRKQDIDEVKHKGSINDDVRREWVVVFQQLEELMRQLQEFDMVWKDTAALVAKLGADLKNDLALIEGAISGSEGAMFKAKNLLRQQADLLEAVVKRSQLLKSDLKGLPAHVDRDTNVKQEERQRLNDVQVPSVKQINETLETFESNLTGIANRLRMGLD